MKVMVDIKILLQKIKRDNPGIDLDLTGLKAYLFDLVVDSPVDPEPAVDLESFQHLYDANSGFADLTPAVGKKANEKKKEEISNTFQLAFPDLSPHAPLEPLVGDLLDGSDEAEAELEVEFETALASLLGPESVAGKSKKNPEVPKSIPQAAKRKSPKDKKEARDAKRKELTDYTNLSGREIMEKLTGQSLLKRKEGQNQFVEVGNYGGDNGGDLEIG